MLSIKEEEKLFKLANKIQLCNYDFDGTHKIKDISYKGKHYKVIYFHNGKPAAAVEIDGD
jgi:hypothetical protein